MRKFDLIIIGAVLLAALVVFLIYWPDSGGAMRVSIVSEGREVESLELTDTPRELTVESGYGKNTVRITPDGAEVVWADCVSQTCVHTGKITESGRIIACLPNHLVISLVGGQGAEVDAVAG